MSSRKSMWSAASIAVLAMSLTACGGGGGDDDEDEGPDDASGAGIWSGNLKLDGQTATTAMFGIVTEESDFVIYGLTAPPRLFFGTGSSNGNNFSANAVTYNPQLRSVPASMQGTIVDRSSITGSYSFTGQSATFSLAYQASIYERPASLALLQGVYSVTIGSNTIAVTVEANGAITIVYPSGCTYTGTSTVPHSNRNYYRSSGAFTGCASADGPATTIMYLSDVNSGQNNQLVIFEQHQAQNYASFLLVSK